MTRATRTSSAARAKVVRMPATTASGPAAVTSAATDPSRLLVTDQTGLCSRMTNSTRRMAPTGIGKRGTEELTPPGPHT